MKTRSYFVSLTLLGLMALTSPVSLWAQPDSNARPNMIPQISVPAPKFAGVALAVPPRQNAPWSAAPDDVFVPATRALFDAGLADPRGLEYRAVQFVVGDSAFGAGEGTTLQTHGWVLPAIAGQKQRFGVAWNGLVYPLVQVGEPVSLREDITQAVAKAVEVGNMTWNNAWEEPIVVAPDFPTSVKVALLLRLGETEAAHQMGEALLQTRGTGDNSKPDLDKEKILVPDAKLWLDDWNWMRFTRALGAHSRGDDYLALLDFRALAPQVPLQQENKDYDFPAFLWQVPQLLADQERRAREAIAPVKPVENDEVTALIRDLENMQVKQRGQPGGVALGMDERVKKLVALGDRAVEPLLDAYADESRLTRSIQFGRNFHRGREVKLVSEAEWSALTSLLKGDADLGEQKMTRAEFVAALRAHWREVKAIPAIERSYRILRDDSASPAAWREAALEITRPRNVTFRDGWTITQNVPEAERTLTGEALRAHTDPSVTELLQRRIEQLNQRALAHAQDRDSESVMDTANDLTKILRAWDGNVGVPALGAQLQQNLLLESARNAQNSGNNFYDDSLKSFMARVEMSFWRRRVRYGSPVQQHEANVDYATWLVRQPFGSVEKNYLQPLWTQAQDPVFAAATQSLFGSPSARWGSFDKEARDGSYAAEVWGLIDSPMMKVPAFRAMVARELNNFHEVGEYRVENEQGKFHVNITGIWGFDLEIPVAERAQYKTGQTGTIKVSDLLAYQLLKQQKVPPQGVTFQFYWPDDKRYRASREVLRLLQEDKLDFNADETFINSRNDN